jgi:hypothetical protein
VLHISISIIILVSIALRLFAVYIENYPGLIIDGVRVGSILVSAGRLVDLPLSVLMSTVAIVILTLVLLVVSLFVLLRKPAAVNKKVKEA